MQVHSFQGGGGVVHRVPFGSGRLSVWHDGKGNATAVERFDRYGRSVRIGRDAIERARRVAMEHRDGPNRGVHANPVGNAPDWAAIGEDLLELVDRGNKGALLARSLAEIAERRGMVTRRGHKAWMSDDWMSWGGHNRSDWMSGLGKQALGLIDGESVFAGDNAQVGRQLMDAASHAVSEHRWKPKDRSGEYMNPVRRGESPLYVEYVRRRPHEDPFEMNGSKWQFVTARYPDGRLDIGVYSFAGDVVYAYDTWRRMHNIQGAASEGSEV